MGNLVNLRQPMSHSFLSYSREQYYFAESLALHLQQRGLPIWFDIQQLEPGVNWAADIQAGLEQAHSLILVASHAALTSPYVAQEWQHALAHQRPIVIALFERCRLPRDLRRRATVIDFRGSFDRGLARLAAYLQNPQPPTRPARTLLRLPRLPVGVRRMVFALALDDLRQMLSVLTIVWVVLQLTAPESPPWQLLAEQLQPADGLDSRWLVALVGLLVIVRRFPSLLSTNRLSLKVPAFVHHRLAAESALYHLEAVKTYWQSLFVTLFWLYGLHYAVAMLDQQGLVPPLEVLLATPWLFSLLLMLLLRCLLAYPIRAAVPPRAHADIVRWSRIDQVPQQWRLQINQGLVNQTTSTLASEQQVAQWADFGPTAPKAEVTGRSFRVVYAESEATQAQRVAQILSETGYHPAPQDTPAATTVLLLSYRTPLALVQDCVRSQAGVIGVLVSDIRLPKNLPELTDLQLVDFRAGQSSELKAAFSYLSREDAVSRANLGLRLLPVNLRRSIGNRHLQQVFDLCLVLSALLLIYTGGYALRQRVLGLPIPSSLLGYASLHPLGFGVLGGVTLLLWAFALATLRGRALIPPRLMSLAAALAMIAALALELRTTWPPFRPNNEPLDELITVLLDPWIGVILALGYLLSLGWLMSLLRRPDVLAHPGPAVLGMPLLRPRRALLWLLLQLALLLAVIILLFQGS